MDVEIKRQNIIILFLKQRGCAVSFLVKHNSEPDIYVGFSPALHLQCILAKHERFRVDFRGISVPGGVLEEEGGSVAPLGQHALSQRENAAF
jgi:hypothetical protein